MLIIPRFTMAVVHYSLLIYSFPAARRTQLLSWTDSCACLDDLKNRKSAERNKTWSGILSLPPYRLRATNSPLPHAPSSSKFLNRSLVLCRAGRAYLVAFDQLISGSRGQGFVVVLALCRGLAAVIEVDFPFAKDLGNRSLDDDGRGFVNADPQELRILRHEGGHIFEAIAGREVLINAHAGQEAEAAFVSFAHHNVRTGRRATHQVIAL